MATDPRAAGPDHGARWLPGREDRADLLVLLHGYGSDPQDMLALGAALPDRYAVVAPRGSLDVGGQSGWWLLDPTLRTPATDVLTAGQRLVGWLGGVLEERRPATVMVGGFSQGMAMASVLLRLRPAWFVRAVGLSGFVPSLELLDVAGQPEPHVPFLWTRGDADLVIPPPAVAAARTWLRASTVLTERVYPGLPHAVDARVLADVSAFLATPTPDPAPPLEPR